MKLIFIFIIIFSITPYNALYSQSLEQGDVYSKIKGGDTLIYWMSYPFAVKKQEGNRAIMASVALFEGKNIYPEYLSLIENIKVDSQSNLDKNVLVDFNDSLFVCLRQHIPLIDGVATYTIFAKSHKTDFYENIFSATWGQHKWSYLQLPYVSDIELPQYDTVIISFSDNTKKKFKLQIINNQYQLIEEK